MRRSERLARVEDLREGGCRGCVHTALGTRALSRCALLGLAIAFVVAGCGSGHSASTTAGPTFPDTPAGVQARWFFQALARLPISDAALRAHAAPAVLAHLTPVEVNSSLAGFGQLRLLSVTSKQPNSVAFVISVRGAQRVRFELNVDARGLIAGFAPQALVPTASPASVIPALAPGWVAGPVAFTAGGVTIYGTYTRPRAATAGTIPGALLLGGSGSTTDRNDNTPEQPHRNALEAVADWLSADGVASLRYDKLGSGQTGWGPYAAHPERVGIKPYEQEAVAGMSFLAGQRQIDRASLAAFGHSEGGIYALLLATGLAGNAPKVHAVGLLEPVNVRFLSLFNWSAAAASATASLRRTGALPSGLPAAVSSVFKANGAPLELSQIDHYDPAALAGRLTPQTPVLLTCSNADDKFTCAQEDRLAAGLTQAKLNYVHLDGVDHFLKEDITRSEAAYNQALPFSTQLQSALRMFTANNL